MDKTKRRSNHQAILLATVPAQIKTENPHRVGMRLSNGNATGVIYYRSGGDGHAMSYEELPAGAFLIIDLHAPHQDLWAYTDTANSVLTLVENFEG